MTPGPSTGSARDVEGTTGGWVDGWLSWRSSRPVFRTSTLPVRGRRRDRGSTCLDSTSDGVQSNVVENGGGPVSVAGPTVPRPDRPG